MSSTPSLYIRATGSFAPENRVTNDDLAKRVDTSHEWIVTRTGIHERRLASDDVACSDIAVEAGKIALKNAGLKPEDIDLLIIGTLTPDMMFPSTAAIVQYKLGLRGIPSMDIDAACTGFLYIMEVARALMSSNPLYQNALIIGAEKLSSILNWEDRTTCVLFGDGAGAAVISRDDTRPNAIYPALLGADGSNGHLIHMPAGGSAKPATPSTVQDNLHTLKMNGKEVFKIAVRVMENACRRVLAEHGVDASELKCVIPHQANIRIIESLAQRLVISMDRVYVNIERYGNTSAASIPLALDEAVQEKKLKKGDLILMVAFGAGLTFGASLVRWDV